MPSRLRIGVNALYLIPGGVGGTEIYLRNLLNALAEIDRHNYYAVYVNRETGDGLVPHAPNFECVRTGVKAQFRPGRLLWEQTGLPLDTRRRGLDVLFSPGFTAPAVSHGVRVTVIHDMQHKRQPQNFGWLERQAWNVTVAAAVKRSPFLISVSESSKSDILSVYGVAPDRVRVVRHGVEPAFFNLRGNELYTPDIPRLAGIPEGRYLLAVSTVHPHKNWERLIDAFRLLAAKTPDLHLAVSGLPGKSWDGLRTALDEYGLTGRVHLLGWQPRPRLIALFKYAEALVFPSTFEGFGMPVSEALACGLPVVCSDIPPLREIADGCATFVDPHSAEAILEGLETCLNDEPRRLRLAARGLERARDFTWRRAAEQTLAVLLEAGKV